MTPFFSVETIFSFITLTFLEIILGIDNLIFIAIAVANLPERYRKKARYFGVFLALIIRIMMLIGLSWVMGLTKPLFNFLGINFSFNNLLLIAGGLFLIIKSGYEILNEVRPKRKPEPQIKETTEKKAKLRNSLFGAIIQIALIDFVFSFDSIITAIGMTKNIPIIVAAVIISMAAMLIATDYLSMILNRYPSLKIIALAFIFMIGIILVTDGFHFKISKGYLYFALFFTIFVESLNIIAQKTNKINRS